MQAVVLQHTIVVAGLGGHVQEARGSAFGLQLAVN